MIKIKTYERSETYTPMILKPTSMDVVQFEIDGVKQCVHVSDDARTITLFDPSTSVSHALRADPGGVVSIYRYVPFEAHVSVDDSVLSRIKPTLRFIDDRWHYDKKLISSKEHVVDCVPGLIIDCSLDSFYGEFGHCSLGPSSQIPGDYQATVIATEIRSSSALLYIQIISDGIANGLVFCTQITDHGNECGVHAAFDDIRLKIEGLSLELGGV